MAGDCFVDGYFLHIAIALVVIAAFYHRIAVPTGETRRPVGTLYTTIQTLIKVLTKI